MIRPAFPNWEFTLLRETLPGWAEGTPAGRRHWCHMFFYNHE